MVFEFRGTEPRGDLRVSSYLADLGNAVLKVLVCYGPGPIGSAPQTRPLWSVNLFAPAGFDITGPILGSVMLKLLPHVPMAQCGVRATPCGRQVVTWLEYEKMPIGNN